MSKPKIITDPKDLRLLVEPEQLKILQADPVRGQSINWTVREIIAGSPESIAQDKELDTARWTETDEADRFKGGRSVAVEKLNKHGWMTLEVVPYLIGRPWNNAALNVVMSLRPSAIRVIVADGSQTLDSYSWRVDIYLDSDGRTIRKIMQAVVVGLIGCRYGADVSSYIEGRVPPPASSGGLFNPRGLRKLHKEGTDLPDGLPGGGTLINEPEGDPT